MGLPSGYYWKTLKDLYEGMPPVEAAELVDEAYPGYSGLWCRYIMTITNLAAVNNMVVLVHGPLSCLAAARNFKTTNYSLYYGQAFTHHPCTKMNEDQVVMGGVENLIESIKAVDRDYRPPLIVVLDTCAPALIGDDIQGAIDQVQPEVGAKVFHLPSPGFTSPWLGRTLEMCSEKYADLMEPPQKVDPEKVNILGQYKEKFCHKTPIVKDQQQWGFRDYPDDAQELARNIDALGLKLHRVLTSGDYDYIRTAPEAGVNAFSCPTWSYPLARAMKAKFGTPHLRHANPTGFESSAAWVRELATFTGRQERAEEYIASEWEQLAADYERCKEAVRGKVALLEGGRHSLTAFARPMAYGRMCRDLGMETYLFNVHPLEIKAKRDDVEYFLWDGYNPKVLGGPYAYNRPATVREVMDELGLDRSQVIYFIDDVFPFAAAGIADPCDVPRVDSSVHHRRVKGAPGRGIGFRGSRAYYRSILESVKAGSRGTRPTFYGRVNSKTPFDFQMQAQAASKKEQGTQSAALPR